MKQKYIFKENLCIYIFSVFTLFFYAPMEMYLTNTSEFWCNLRLIWWIPLVISIIVFLIVVTFEMLIPDNILRKLFAIAVFAGGFCAYLQGNFLSINLGLMNGTKIDWDGMNTKLRINLVLWFIIIMIIIIIGMIKTNLTIKICRYLSILLIGMQLTMFIYLLIPVLRGGWMEC